MISGVGAGEGLAAVCGHQSGAEGATVEKPMFSREIAKCDLSIIRFPAPTPLFAVRLESAPYHERENT